jgi:nickel transport protein
MRSFLPLLLCLGLSAISSAAAHGHGSNVFESAETPDQATSQHSHSAAHASGDSGDEFEELHEQIEHLEERLNAHDERVRMSDILGGIGYIVGISGVAYYYFGARRRKRQ